MQLRFENNKSTREAPTLATSYRFHADNCFLLLGALLYVTCAYIFHL